MSANRVLLRTFNKGLLIELAQSSYSLIDVSTHLSLNDSKSHQIGNECYMIIEKKVNFLFMLFPLEDKSNCA